MNLKKGWGEKRVADVRVAVIARGETVRVPTAAEDLEWTARHLQGVLGLSVVVKEEWAVSGRAAVAVRPAVPVELMLDLVIGSEEGVFWWRRWCWSRGGCSRRSRSGRRGCAGGSRSCPGCGGG